MFEYYVMNESRYGKNKIEPFNIFNNWVLDEAVQKEVKRYLRAPKKYKNVTQYANSFLGTEEIAIYGFDAFCETLRRLISWQERGRCEYEVAIGSLFTTEIHDVVRDLDKYDSLETLKDELIKLDNNNKRLQKIDCYMQCEKNIKTIAREVIYQWKHRKENADGV